MLQLFFECTDGYKPTMPLARLYDGVKLYIVYKDLGEKGNKSWADSIDSKCKPYYLVWDSAKKNTTLLYGRMAASASR
jgi:hypothetical protein